MTPLAVEPVVRVRIPATPVMSGGARRSACAVRRHGGLAAAGSGEHRPAAGCFVADVGLHPVQCEWSGGVGGRRLTLGSSEDQAKAIDASIARSRRRRRHDLVRRENGTSLAQYYAQHGKSAQELATAYGAVIDAYGLNRIDFDIEGAAVADPASIALNAQALKIAETARPDLEVWYTLPVLPNGLTADGINVVEQAPKAGVKLDGIINVMAMNLAPRWRRPPVPVPRPWAPTPSIPLSRPSTR